jgi:FtsP/CotA-like multicopper oxidase with cupredoxin domain
LPPESDTGLPRRGFLALGAGAFLCSIGGDQVVLSRPGDAAKADAAARRVAPPRARAARTTPPQGGDPVDQLKFPTPQPQPGGVKREYWIQARDVLWDIVPTRPRRDQWHGRAIAGPSVYRAFVYQQMTEGFAAPVAGPTIPGPTLYAEVGDTLVVHFRNGLSEKTSQALTMHPHGVKYNPDYDGVYLGDFTRAGGFIAPGDEFTYTWEATPDSVGVWPYHDHGPNHTLNTFRGLFGAVVVREKGAKPPDVEAVLFFHSLAPPVTGLERQFQCVNGRAFAGNTPTLRSRVGQDVAIHVMGMDSNFHDFHIHGHRWKDPGGTFVDTPAVGPNETITARFVEDNPGRWLYHCHVFTHQDGGMAGWYLVEP